ncbi:unnamed protein product, partial [Schistosoma mattheei]
MIHMRRKKQISDAETEMTGVPSNYTLLHDFFLLWHLICSLPQLVFADSVWPTDPNCKYAALALLTRTFTSASDPPCSSIMLPKYVKLHEKLTSPCIPHSDGKADSMAGCVYRQIFLDCANSSNGFTPCSKSETTYASPTEMRNIKISQYEIISAKMMEAKRLYEDLDFPANNNSIGDLQQVLG